MFFNKLQRDTISYEAGPYMIRDLLVGVAKTILYHPTLTSTTYKTDL